MNKRMRAAVRNGIGFFREICKILILSTLALQGCGTVDHSLKFKKGYSYSSDTKIEVGKIENKTGEKFDIEIDRMLRAALKNELKKRELLWAGRTEPKLISNCNILDYAKGNALLRAIPWLASTRLRIECELMDESSVVGNILAKRTVDYGGGFTIGDWAQVFNELAVDVVEDIEWKMKCPNCEDVE